MIDNYDVIIAGAGIAGLAGLRGLHGAGISAIAVEQRVIAADAGLAINLPGNAIAALNELGLADSLECYGRPVQRREYRTEHGRLLFAVDESAFWGTELTPRCLRRSDLMALLAAGLPEGTIRRGVKITDVVANGDQVKITTSGSNTLTSRLIVGADGVHSTIRARCFEGESLTTARIASASWRFMVPNPGVDCWTVWAGAKAMVLLIPLDNHQIYGWVAAADHLNTGQDPTILGDLIRSFPEPVVKAVQMALTSPQALHYSPLDEVRLSRWNRPGVVLVGDAAHATAPVWAQGAALALEDLCVLTRLLKSRKDWTGALAEYEQLRRPRVNHVQAMTDRMSKAVKLPIVIRNLIMPFVGPRSYRATYEALRELV